MNHRRTIPSAPGARRLALALGLCAALAACTSKAERAAQYDQLADQMLAVRAFPAAAGTLQRAVALDANNADRWVRLGRAQRQMDQVAPAAASYQRALDLAPDNVEALQALSVLLVRGGQFDLAKSYAATLAVLAPDDLGGLLTQGAIAVHESRLIDADKIADRIMTLAPSLSEGFILKARVMESRGDVVGAAELLQRRLTFDPGNVDLAQQVLRLNRKIGSREGIRNVALLLAKVQPDDPRYQLEAARALRARGQSGRSDALLAAAATRWRGNPQVLLGVAHQWLDDAPRAAAVARIVSLATGAPPASQAALATLLVQVGEPARALALLAPAVGGTIDSATVDLHAAYANALLALGRDAAARGKSDQVLAFDNRNPQALLVRARTEAARRDFRRALDDAQLAMADSEQSSEAALLVAQLWAAQGNAVLADKAFGTAQDRFPADLAIHAARIRWLIGQGRTEDATRLATAFLGQHGSPTALRLVAEACDAGHHTACAAEARRHLPKG